MTNDRWQMTDDRWQMMHYRLQMTDDRRHMTNDRWQILDDRWWYIMLKVSFTWEDNDVRLVADPLVPVLFTYQHHPVLSGWGQALSFWLYHCITVWLLTVWLLTVLLLTVSLLNVWLLTVWLFNVWLLTFWLLKGWLLIALFWLLDFWLLDLCVSYHCTVRLLGFYFINIWWPDILHIVFFCLYWKVMPTNYLT